MKRLFILFLALTLIIPAFGAAQAAEGGQVMIPELKNIYRFDMPESEALAFTRQMKIGWNLGNTFDAINDGNVRDEMTIETAWVGVKTSEEMIVALKDAGFNTIRIPVSWHNHVSGKDFTISEKWLSRVQEVVDWAIGQDMFVILNTHHDVYPEYCYPSREHYATAEKYITSIWTQLSARFVDYGDHLIFESMNEPRLKDTAVEWWFEEGNQQALESAECVNLLNQAFVNTVRAGGGQNESRYLMVPGYCAAPGFACADYFRLPEDTAENKLIVSVHAYTPYSFALDLKGTDKFTAFGAASTQEIAVFMNSLYKKFIQNGVPVVIGEFGALEKNGNLQARVDFAAYYVAAASARGIPCCWWDNHLFKGNGERFGLMDRKTATWAVPEIVDAMMTYAGYETMPVKPE
ncbi:MAG: glycoside hydrolase family 5 protein [Clostridia bacterium]|nr:glycoside hydrolase family 5 protein [Clostridia bacterium]